MEDLEEKEFQLLWVHKSKLKRHIGFGMGHCYEFSINTLGHGIGISIL